VVSGLLLLVRVATGWFGDSVPFLRTVFVPTGALLIDYVLSFCAIVGLRSMRRVQVERAGKLQREATGDIARTILIGATDAAMLVIKESEAHPELGIKPVAILDDDPTKQGTMLHGVAVVGRTSEIPRAVKDVAATQVLLAISEPSGADIRRLKKACDAAAVPMKMVPAITEFVSGRANLTHVREVAIEDLLRREPVRLDEEAILAFVRDRAVLVTGAGGSIGSELCRQIAPFAPKELVLVERSENALFEIHREIVRNHPGIKVLPMLADICDEPRMDQIFARVKPALVLHAAAHKHVPMMEWNPGEAVKNNILGTKRVADLAGRYGVERFVMISTDKAVNPSSIMGATKRVAELYIQALSKTQKTRYVAVRFGNVLGSAGSVVPIFREQIARGGPVTVTHPEMRRYFMTIPEASQLVLQAGAMGKGGEIFILDMGEPVLIVDLAEDLIRLSGLRPNDDIEIKFTGMRPGEKLFEELSVEEEAAEKTLHSKVFVGKLNGRPLEWLEDRFVALEGACENADREGIRTLLTELVPEMVEPERDEPRAKTTEPTKSTEASATFGVEAALAVPR
jgi:FlaA1/EpsC-like NDP-sugar epimerase